MMPKMVRTGCRVAAAGLVLWALPALAQDPPVAGGEATGAEGAGAAVVAQEEPGPAGEPEPETTGQGGPRAAEGGEPFDPEAATQAYLDRLSPEEKRRSDAYYEGGYWLQLWGFLYGLAIAWLLLGTRLSARMRDLAERISRFKPLQTALYALQYILLMVVLTFPLTLYQGFLREHQYDLSNQSFAQWMVEQLKGLGLNLILMPLLLIVLYGVLRKAPRTWWLWGAAVALAFLAVVIVISPIFIAPLFNEYTRLEDPAVREPILEMAQANGVPATDVWVYDASRQSDRISANVSGFLGTERISLNDNLLNRSSLAEIKAVMGHELGHYVLHHVHEALLQIGLVLVVGFAFLSWSFDRVRRRWGGSWGVRGIGDVAGLPLLSALLAVYFFAMTPVLNTIIRSNEVEADLFGLNAAREPDGFAEAALKLGEYRKLAPGPVEEFIFFDHPSGENRIRMAMRWKAEVLDGEE